MQNDAIPETPTRPTPVAVDVGQVINAYDSPLVRAYCWGRFKILRLRFLEEIGQYLPASGRVLDVGCGFGLFSQYFAMRYPNIEIHGIDVNPGRIEMAQRTAVRLGLDNVQYRVGDARSLDLSERFEGCYMLDIVHHVPTQAVQPLFQHLADHLPTGARLLVKDVDSKPLLKRWFTHILDKAMDPTADVHYWDTQELVRLIGEQGFEVHHHAMRDVLPYPHVLYINTKR